MDFHEDPQPKNKKNKIVNLDFLHNDKIKQFEKNKQEIPIKRNKLNLLKEKIAKLESTNPSLLTEEILKEIYILQQQKRELEVEINKIENGQNICDYFVQSGDILYQYYDAIEKTNTTRGNKSILELFGNKITEDNEVSENKSSSKHTLLTKYLSIHHRDLLTENNENEIEDICCFCGSEKNFFQQEALLICPTCGDTEFILLDSNRPSYKEPPREMTFYSYKRINHFNEWLAQFQAKESTDIPEEVYNKILLELKKERISNMAVLTPLKIKEILKKLKYNKYYEHIPHIINHLNSIPAPIMTRETEEKLRSMFKQIQAPFMKYCPNDRNNFLSYSYVLHKFCQLLNLDEFLVCFPLLKSREKLHKHDQIWEKICQELQWEFIKSI
jgi:hypothetical protein